jgi:hypothetical protein
MFSSNLIKIFFVFALLSCQACSFCQSKTDATVSPTPFVVEELKSEIPFLTKEPEVFQTEIVVTAKDNIEDKTFIAKNGANRFIVFDFQGKTEFALLQLGANQSFLIAPSQKIFAENQPETIGEKSETLNDLLTAGWSNQKADAKFERLGAENNFVKYLVNLDETKKSEIIITVDEKNGLPVKQEFYSISNEQRTLTLTMEMKNFSLQTDAKFFEVPKDYKKVLLKEFRETLRRMRAK